MVKCRIDEATWQDTDYQLTVSGQVPVEDTMGDVAWTADGRGTVMPADGKETTLTAHKTPGPVTVTARVLDSRTKGKDPEVIKEVIFNVLKPTGRRILAQRNHPDTQLWEAPPPDNVLGCRTRFDCQILPDTVNFSKAELREKLPADPMNPDKWTWPDGTEETLQAFEASLGQVNHLGVPNFYYDNVGEWGDPYTRLKDKDTNEFKDFTFNNLIPLQFKNQDGQWEEFVRDSHPREYKANGQSRVGIKATNTLWGNWMGPWSKTP